MTIHISFTRESALPPGTFPCYARVKFHTERYGVNILEYTGVPARFGGIPSVMQRIQTAQEKPVTMTRALQLWSYGLIKSQAPAGMVESDMRKCWLHTYTSDVAFANKSGPEWLNDDGELAYADFVNDTNTDAEGWRLQPTISHGHTVRVLRTFQRAGMTQAAFQIADAFDPSTLLMTRESHPHLIMCATNWSRGRRADGTLTPGYPNGYAEPFPKLGGRDVLVPLLGNHATESYIDNDWLEYLPADASIPAYPYTR